MNLVARDERMVHAEARASRAEPAPRSSAEAPESDDLFHFSDDDYDFPPTAHPGRELVTASLFVLLIMALVVWSGWKLISLI
jgi:hypothetical protein